MITTNLSLAGECSDPLRAPLELTWGWRLPVRDLERYVSENPSMREELTAKVALANFIAEGQDEIFGLMGSFQEVYRLAHSEMSLSEALATQEECLLPLIEVAIESGSFPKHLNTVGIRKLLFLGFPPVDLRTHSIPALPQSSDEIAAGVQAVSSATKIPFKKLALHSNLMQTGLLGAVAYKLGKPTNFGERLLAKFQARLRGFPEKETWIETEIFETAQGYLRGNIHQTNREKLLSKTRALRANGQQASVDEEKLRKIILFNFIHSLDFMGESAKLYAPDATDISTSVSAIHVFNDVLSRDIFIDQGIGEELRSLVLGQRIDIQTASARQVRQRITDSLKKDFRRIEDEVRVSRSQIKTAIAPLKSAPVDGRSERIQRYQSDRMLTETNATVAEPVMSDSVVAEGPAPEVADDIDGLWSTIENGALDLASVRVLFESMFALEQTVTIPLQRSGYIHRVRLAKELLIQILNPKGAEPLDPRIWVEALRAGPARATGQKGWHKLVQRYDGLYDWSIKILGSPYRMLGFRTAHGVWQFDKIVLFHR